MPRMTRSLVLLLALVSAAQADPKPEPAGVPKCRALDVADPKVVFEEAEDKLSTTCLKKLQAKLQQKWCSAENKGKKFDYMTDYDHTIGAGQYLKKVKGAKATYTCRVVNK